MAKGLAYSDLVNPSLARFLVEHEETILALLEEALKEGKASTHIEEWLGREQSMIVKIKDGRAVVYVAVHDEPLDEETEVYTPYPTAEILLKETEGGKYLVRPVFWCMNCREEITWDDILERGRWACSGCGLEDRGKAIIKCRYCGAENHVIVECAYCPAHWCPYSFLIKTGGKCARCGRLLYRHRTLRYLYCKHCREKIEEPRLEEESPVPVEVPGKCPICGAWLLEDFMDGHLYCKYCGWKEVIDIDEE